MLGHENCEYLVYIVKGVVEVEEKSKDPEEESKVSIYGFMDTFDDVSNIL